MIFHRIFFSCIKYSVRNTNSSQSFNKIATLIILLTSWKLLCARHKFCKNKENVQRETLYLLEKLMLDVKVVRRAAISDGTQGSRRGIDVIVIIAWQWYRSIIDCRFASLPLPPCYFKLLDRCSGCSTSYTMFSVFVYIFLLSNHNCTIFFFFFFFNVVRIALSYIPFSLLFFTSTYLGCSSFNSVFRRCTRCQWLFSVLRCRPMLVVASLRDFTKSSVPEIRHESVSRSATPSSAELKISLQNVILSRKQNKFIL